MNGRDQSQDVTGAVMVVGGGVAGIQSALDLADSGYYVYLVEKESSIGGVMAQLDKTFPTNDCSMCILSPKLVEVGRHTNIELVTYSEVMGISGEPGNFRVKVLQKPRYIDVEKCTGCGDCGRVLVDDEHPPKEKDGLFWVDRIRIDESKCIHCGDCARACAVENPLAPAMTNVVRQRFRDAEQKPEVVQDYTVTQRVLTMSAEEREIFWSEQFARCIKCYGCLETCPVYIPRTDGLDPRRVTIGGPQPPAPYPLFHLLRAFNVWDTCIVCGECEKACPAEIPLKSLQDMVVFMDPEKVFEMVPGLDEATRKRILDAVAKRREALEQNAKVSEAV